MQRFGPLQSPDTYSLIGACLEVHRELGTGFLEAVYQEALALELDDRGIPFEREMHLGITYKGRRLARTYRADFICNANTILELKAQSALGPADMAQATHYLRATGHHLALLVNFGSKELEIRRLVI